MDKNNKALWFSKNIIPAIRNEEELRKDDPKQSPVHQHMGLYGYRMDILERFCALPQGQYERLEGLEQLRLLENAITVQCLPIILKSGIMQSGIDTVDDLARAEAMLAVMDRQAS
jgi:CMP-2-keto-3-deoxyoctulosonic acid synthetase